MTFRDLRPGDRFVFLSDPTRECTKVDDQHYAYFSGEGSTLAEQERVAYGRVGVGDNPVRLLVRP
jgi:hypothetical protein